MGVDPLSLGVSALATGALWGGMGLGKRSSGSFSKQIKGMVDSAQGASAIPAPKAEATEADKAKIRKRTPTLLGGTLTGGEEFGTPAPTLLGGDVTKKKTLG